MLGYYDEDLQTSERRVSRREMPRGNKREMMLQELAQLEAERSSFDPHYQLLSDFILPWSARMFVEDRNRGERRHDRIIDSTCTRAVRTISAGLMALSSSAARPWFVVEAEDPELRKRPAVMDWCDKVTRLLRDFLSGTNCYRAMHQQYEEIVVFGTGACLVLPDAERGLHFYPQTCGEYWIGNNWKSEVDTLYRKFQMTVIQMVRQFGYENCSKAVQDLYDNGRNDHSWITVVHAVRPNEERTRGKLDSRNMPWQSCYFELGRSDARSAGDVGLEWTKKLLSHSGFRRFRATTPRWGLSGRDVYGNSPGMDALADVKGLQHKQKRKAQAINIQTVPSFTGPSTVSGDELKLLPGEYNPADVTSREGGIRPLFESKLDLADLRLDIIDQRMTIEATMFADLYRMLQDTVDQRKTAQEVRGLQEEKLTQLGPFSERLQHEMHEPIVDMGFEAGIALDMFPPPPPEMDGQALRVRFVSVLALAQRAIDTSSIDRWTMHLGTLRDLGHSNVIHKLDADASADHYADVIGVPRDLVVSGKRLALVREAEARARAAVDQAQLARTNAETAQKLGQTPTQGPNLLSEVIGDRTGYLHPSVTAAAG